MIKMNSEVKSINCTLTNDIALFKILFEVIFVVSTTIQPELFRMSNLYERSEFFVPYARDGIEAPFKAHKNKNHWYFDQEHTPQWVSPLKYLKFISK